MPTKKGIMVRVPRDAHARLQSLKARYSLAYSKQSHLTTWWEGDDGPSLGELIHRLIDLDISRLRRSAKKGRKDICDSDWRPTDIVDIVR